MEKNCWEFKKCGRQEGGEHVHDLGICPASREIKLDGIHGGKNGGRACWVVAGTLCEGNVQGSYATKYKNCTDCDFYHAVKKNRISQIHAVGGPLAAVKGSPTDQIACHRSGIFRRVFQRHVPAADDLPPGPADERSRRRSAGEINDTWRYHDMAKLNCWEYKRCGRQPGGDRTNDLGICPVATHQDLHGAHGGVNAGRACWAIAGSLCGGKIQGTYAEKLTNCWRCDFMNIVKKEEEPSALGFSATRLGMEKAREKLRLGHQ